MITEKKSLYVLTQMSHSRSNSIAKIYRCLNLWVRHLQEWTPWIQRPTALAFTLKLHRVIQTRRKSLITKNFACSIWILLFLPSVSTSVHAYVSFLLSGK